jgi:hypothetical protein
MKKLLFVCSQNRLRSPTAEAGEASINRFGSYKFQPRQIVCLEHETTRLYAEIIEFVEARQVCWVRPLMLAVAVADSEPLSVAIPRTTNVVRLALGCRFIVACKFI